MRTRSGLAVLALLGATTLAAQSAATGAEPTAAQRPGPLGSALQALAAHPGAARAVEGQAFAPDRTVTDADGGTHVRMQRTLDGVPVLGGDLVVHQAPGAGYEGVSQTLREPLTLGTVPAVSAAAAGARALAPGKLVASITGIEQTGAPRLVVDALGAAPRLAWEVLSGGVQEDGTPSRMATYVDARTGGVLRREEQVVNVDGTGQTLYSGTVPLNPTASGSTFQLKDAARGGTYTTDVGNATDGPLCAVARIGCRNGTQVTSPTPGFGDGTTSDRRTAAADAQYGTDATWDYFVQVHDRQGIFGTGQGSFNRVHYGTDYVNAFWDGTKMTFGDGDGVAFGPLVSLDVTGHEMAHGVTENTAGLVYSGESGGLNEATSDIFGTMVEFHEANPSDPGDYLIGEEFDLQQGLGFRRMDDPIADGSSPGCYSAQTKDLDVHYSSGVGNHFFYLLAEGSGSKVINGVQHRSTTCDGSTLTGIGREASQEIWYRALDVYMTSGTTYAGARTATLAAAADLYGAGSREQAAVAAAWSAVSVG